MSQHLTLTIGEQLADHNARIEHIEKTQDEHGKKLDRLIWGMLCALTGIAGNLIAVLSKK